jgi:hypothetical protein
MNLLSLRQHVSAPPDSDAQAREFFVRLFCGDTVGARQLAAEPFAWFGAAVDWGSSKIEQFVACKRPIMGAVRKLERHWADMFPTECRTEIFGALDTTDGVVFVDMGIDGEMFTLCVIVGRDGVKRVSDAGSFKQAVEDLAAAA